MAQRMGVVKQMKILTIVHWADLFQLSLQAESLSKFWLGNKRWTVVIEDPILDVQQRSLAWCKKNIHIEGWDIDFVIPNTSEVRYNGWIRQQQFKLYYSAHAIEDWVLILDAKNFLIKPTDKSFFIRDDTVIYLPAFNTEEFFRKTTEDAAKLLNMHDPIPKAASMTPWVFNKQEVLSLNTKLGIDINCWPSPTNATEFTLYWTWAYSKFNWTPVQFVTGFWQEKYSNTITTVPSMFDIKEGARTIDDIRFWTHHRYTLDPLARQVTTEFLEEMGLSTEVLTRWNTEFGKNSNSNKTRTHQEFLKNRKETDPGFDPRWYTDNTI